MRYENGTKEIILKDIQAHKNYSKLPGCIHIVYLRETERAFERLGFEFIEPDHADTLKIRHLLKPLEYYDFFPQLIHFPLVADIVPTHPTNRCVYV